MDVRALALEAQDLVNHVTDALVVVVAGDPAKQRLPAPLSTLLKDASAHGDLSDKVRQLYVHRPAGLKAARLVLCALDAASPKALRQALASALGLLKGTGAKGATLALAGADWTAELAGAAVSAAHDAVYVYRHTKPSAPAASSLSRLTIGGTSSQAGLLRKAIQQATAVAHGVALAKECANRPANHATPTYLAAQARKLGKEFGFKVEVLDRKAVEKLGMGAFLAVAQGGDEPLRFIVVRYDGAARAQAPIVLVGKGITFDTGGISIKPSAEMDEMKFDMCGAASVLGTLRAVGELKPKLNLVGIIPACENMPSGRAIKPGDVVTSMSGQTIEVLNTDAEGRLILCDALTYARRFKPAMVVDIATLTGACVIALGNQHTGLFCDDEAMADALLAAGRVSLDTAWRMPLDDDYGDGLKSNFADLGNVGPRAGGAITAAVFLKKFTKDLRWAHLDIAGTAWRSGAAKGATGRPVGLLTRFLLDQVGG